MENTQAQHEKYIQMTTKPVEMLICKMAIPSIVTVLVTSIYNAADTIYVGRISTEATAAVGIVFSYMALMQAIGFFFGHGSANYISRALGAKNTEAAKKMAATGFISAFVSGVIVAVLVYIFMKPLLILLGATDSNMADSINYLKYILIGTPWIIVSFVLNNQMRLQGNAILGMIGISVGAFLNIILDPFFIFNLNMGVSGAALATIISQFISFIILFNMTGKRGGVKIEFKNFSPSFGRYFEIVSGGLPSLGRQGIASVATIILNRYAGLFGDSAIAAFSIVNRIMMFSAAALIGFGQGFQPVCGFNYGAKLFKRVRKAFWFCVKVGTIYCVFFAILGMIYAPQAIRLFRGEDIRLVEIGSATLRYQCIAFPFLGYITIVSMYLQNIGMTLNASLLAVARQGLFFIPISFIFVNAFGLTGLELTQPVSDIFTFIFALPLGIIAVNNMRKIS